MSIINKMRALRPSTRQSSSSYRIHCDEVGEGDTLKVNINHESDPSVHFVYEIDGNELTNLNSLHFDAELVNGEWQISWRQNVNIRRIR